MSRDDKIRAAKAHLKSALEKIEDPKAKAILRPVLEKLFQAWDENTEIFKGLSDSISKINSEFEVKKEANGEE